MGRIAFWNSWVLSFENSVAELLHAVGGERRLESDHLVEDAAERPDVRAVVVRFVLPDLWTGVVRSACLGVDEALLCDLRNVEVSKLDCAVLVHEHIGALEVSVENFKFVEVLEPFYDLNEGFPNFSLVEESAVVLVLVDSFVEVASVGVLHDDAECLWVGREKCLLVGDDVWVAGVKSFLLD